MQFEERIINNYLKILCPTSLVDFSHRFINYYNNDINRIKSFFEIEEDVDLVVALFDDLEKIGYHYSKTDFSGYFTDNGAAAYVKENGKYSDDYLFKGIMHELVHYLYKNYVYGTDKKRITWVDEGLAQFVSNQKKDFLDDEDSIRNLIIENDGINLNRLNHDDKSFGENNGYKLSIIAIKYLYDNNSHDDFIKIIKDEKTLLNVGENIISDIRRSYGINK